MSRSRVSGIEVIEQARDLVARAARAQDLQPA
jgi:hypothetical protein